MMLVYLPVMGRFCSKILTDDPWGDPKKGAVRVGDAEGKG